MKNNFPDSIRKEDQNYILILFEIIRCNSSDLLKLIVLLIIGIYHFPHTLAVNIKL